MDSIHFNVGEKLWITEIKIQSVCKDLPVGDLCSVTLFWPETDFAFEIHVPCSKEPFIQIGIHGGDRHIQFRVIGLLFC